MTNRHATQPATDTQGMSPRAFAGILGAIAVIVAMAFMTTPVHVDGQLGSCGTVISPDDQYSPIATVLCDEAVGDQRAWTIPVGVAGLVLVAGALVIRPRRPAEQ